MRKKCRAHLYGVDERLLAAEKLAVLDICQGNQCLCEFFPPENDEESTITFEVEGEEEDLKRCEAELNRHKESLRNFIQIVNVGTGCLTLPLVLLGRIFG